MTGRLLNIRTMHLLERLAEGFHQARVPVLVTGHAALNLTVYDQPEARPSGTLDLMVRTRHTAAAMCVLDDFGHATTRPAGSALPKDCGHIEYACGEVSPVTVALHVRPFATPRYSRYMPDNAFWDHAVPAGCGDALIPSSEDMLIHLAVQAAIDGRRRNALRRTIRSWVRGRSIDWDVFVARAVAWRLALPVREGIGVRFERAGRDVLPAEVATSLARARVGWRDRLALRRAH